MGKTRININITKAAIIMAALICLIFNGAITPAYAAGCLPGLPCVTNKTTKPNASGAPNASKLEASKCTGGNSANCACDADFMNEIYAKAYLEAQRENIMNEVIVRKPDSVLAYSCFDQMAQMTGDQAPNFSESSDWIAKSVTIGAGAIALVPVPVVILSVYMGPGRLINDLQSVVLPAMSTWINSNYNHSFLGGSTSISYATGGSSYDCSFMDQVYFLAKCNDFETDDPFLSFDTLINTDPRLLPTQCTGGTKITQGYIDLANNKGHAYAAVDDVSPTYIDRLESSPCQDPIPSGVMVTRDIKSIDMLGNVKVTSTTTYQEKICPNPSCHYDNNADSCVNN